MPIHRRSLLAGLLLAGIRPDRVLARAAAEAGSILGASGESTAQARGRIRLLSVGDPVYLNDLLATGERARLSAQLGDATRLLLGARTRVRIDKFLIDRGGRLVLERGAIMFDRAHDRPSGELSVTTPFGLIAARGTRFFAGPSWGKFGVYVEDGVVDVATRGGTVRLTPGFGTELTGMQAAPAAPAPWSPLRISEARSVVVGPRNTFGGGDMSPLGGGSTPPSGGGGAAPLGGGTSLNHTSGGSHPKP
ncbi:FecR domain-containing protein [Labrys sp. LIt4]|uniref:FecR family protein n=1 Tax=Labrys sp. LIt4 TaxID=2821355 RepID=UPI001ADF2331|nr:FecR family protein [Labrys sp. LIt4]MBP0579945.1 FecR domain-containing protein [Labrys sp. LIt4]